MKKFLLPPRETLFTTRNVDGKCEFSAPNGSPQKLAVVGVHACDLKAIAIQDKVLLRSGFVDEGYKRRRENLFLIAVNCVRAAPTCFCHSMGCGPGVTEGFDLALTELDDTFVVSVGTALGGEVIATTDWSPCTLEQVERAQQVTAELRAAMESRTPGEDSVLLEGGSHPRSVDTSDLRELLLENLNHPRWQQIADRCLACGNCTMVCPDVFLLCGRRGGRPLWRKRHSATCLGFVFHGRALLHQYRNDPQVDRFALSPMANSQASDLARPVWRIGLCGLRALHYLVPRGNRSD